MSEPEQNELEFHYEGPRHARPGSPDDFVFVYDEAKRPVVVLLGWAGCQDKYLAKYSAIYEERSCATVRCTAPLKYLFWRRHRLPAASRQLLELIGEKSEGDRPVFFHIFSNGGAIFYQHISAAMEQANSQLKVKGVIFDSSPGRRRITSLYRAVSAIMGGHPFTNVPISLAFTFILSVFWLIEILMHLVDKRTPSTDPSALSEESYSWPQIFLYSNADTLVQASDVEAFAKRRAERGVRAQLVLFTDSEHVRHYAAYRKVYVGTVCGFVNQCLGERPTDDEQRSSGEEEEEEEAPSEEEYAYLPSLTKRIVLPHEASGR